MQIEQHYVNLRSALPVDNDAPLTITLERIAHICSCTERNAKLLLKQMGELGWITWSPGRGRGNKSTIVFRKQIEEVVFILAEELVQKGHFQRAFALLDQYQVKGTLLDSFIQWIYQYLGYQVETRDHSDYETLRFPFYRTIPRLDPLYVTRRTEAHMVKQLFDTLVRFDPETKTIKPHMAHYWECNDVGTEWTFYLRKGILFHHNKQLTAHDVKFTLERLRDKADVSPFYKTFADIQEIVVEKETMIHVRIAGTNFLFLHFLSSTCASIVPRDVLLSQPEQFMHMPIGTGPFRLTQNDHSMFRLEAFANYFWGRPHLDCIELWIIPELGEFPVYELSGNQISYFPFGVKPKNGTRGLLDVNHIEMGANFITFNLRKTGVVQHPAFREAFHYIIDRTKLIEELGEARYCPAQSLIPIDLNSAEIRGTISQHRIDLAKIESHLQSSGYNGETLKLFTYQPGSSSEKDAYWIQQECKQVGISIEVRVYEIEELQQQETIMEADFILTGEVFDDDLELSLVETYQRSSSFIRNHLNDELLTQVDLKLGEVIREPSSVLRMNQLLSIDRFLSEERALLFLYHSEHSTKHHQSLSGVNLNSYGWADYRTLWFKEK